MKIVGLITIALLHILKNMTQQRSFWSNVKERAIKKDAKGKDTEEKRKGKNKRKRVGGRSSKTLVKIKDNVTWQTVMQWDYQWASQLAKWHKYLIMTNIKAYLFCNVHTNILYCKPCQELY